MGRGLPLSRNRSSIVWAMPSLVPGEAVPEAVYNLVLVQDEQEHQGGNGIVFHKMVVRDLLTIDPKGPRTARFDLAASEKAADEYLSAFEKSYTRIPDFKWEVRRHVIPRRGLKVVFFVQDRTTLKVLNAAVAGPAGQRFGASIGIPALC